MAPLRGTSCQLVPPLRPRSQTPVWERAPRNSGFAAGPGAGRETGVSQTRAQTGVWAPGASRGRFCEASLTSSLPVGVAGQPDLQGAGGVEGFVLDSDRQCGVRHGLRLDDDARLLVDQ